MKKKIALFLAFSMLLSIVPISTFAQPWTWHRTGTMWEAMGPATNVRHWAPGVLVGRQTQVNAVANYPDNVDSQGRRFIPTGGGNLRHIIASADYFMNHPGIPMASVRMQIENVESWLASLNGGPSETFWWLGGTVHGGTEGYNFENWLTDAHGYDFYNLTPTQAALVAHMDGVFYDDAGNPRTIGFIDWIASSSPPYFGTMVVIENETVAHMVLLRHGAGWQNHTNPASSVNIPIEYLTNGDTNDNPVYLTFNERSGWPQAGEAGRRTYLTQNQPSRFNFSLDGDPRSFHRYGRSDLEGIRIAEAVQGAFDARDWFIELNIVTPGFFWTAASIENIEFESRFREGTRIGDPQLISNVTRYPDRGNNRFRSLNFAVDLPGALHPNRLVNDWFDIQGLSIAADYRARPGNVEVEIVLRRTALAESTVQPGSWVWRWEPYTDAGNLNYGPVVTNWPTNFIDTAVASQGGTVSVYRTPAGVLTTTSAGNEYVGTFRSNFQQPVPGWSNLVGGTEVYDGVITVARYGMVGLELIVHEDDDAEDFWLRSGMRDWGFDLQEYGVGRRPIGAVNASSVNPDYHRTARVILRETVPGSLPATGAHPTVFQFPEGIQVLGARMWTNNADFSAGHNDSDDEIWFGDVRFEPDNFLNASIQRSSVTIRPEIGETITRRNRVAEITAEFYLSVQPGYEGLFGDIIEVTAISGTIDSPFEDSVTVAHAWDPITVDTTMVVLDESDIQAAFGVVRAVPLSDVTITETESGTLVPGTRLWLGVEGGLSRGWGAADILSLGATNVRVEGDNQLQVSRPRLDSHGVYVEILRGSRDDGARIIFEGVAVSGRVIPNHEYNIIVGDNAVADNWNEFVWLREELGMGVARGSVHGFFTEEPYATPAFRFEGADIFAPPVAAPEAPPQQVATAPRTVTLFEGMNHRTTDGYDLMAPLFLLIPNTENPDFSTSYVMMRVVADVLGLEWHWDPATQTARFSDGMTEVTFSHNSSTAMVNGVPMEIRASGLPADARIINDRFFVPIAFFRYIFNANVSWNGASRSVTVTAR